MSSLVAGLFQKADIIVTTSPQFFVNFTGLALTRLKRVPWIFELRDLWPESIRAVGAIQEGEVLDMLERIELFFYRRATRVIALTPSFKRNLVQRGIDEHKIDVVPNGANLDVFSPQNKDQGLIAELGLQNRFVIAYIGTHGMAHSLEFIVRSLAELNDPEIHFLFIGDGGVKRNIVQTAGQLQLKNVTFLEPMPKQEVRRYLSISDVSLVPLIKKETFKTVIPSKIFEAAAMRKPILLGVDGQAREIVEEHGAGLFFEPENEGDFLDKVRLIKEDKGLYERLQDGCEALARAYDRKQLAGEMYACLREVAGGRMTEDGGIEEEDR